MANTFDISRFMSDTKICISYKQPKMHTYTICDIQNEKKERTHVHFAMSYLPKTVFSFKNIHKPVAFRLTI